MSTPFILWFRFLEIDLDFAYVETLVDAAFSRFYCVS